MTRYECPDCGGGFPSPDDGECPWCGEALDGEKRTPTIGAPLDPPSNITGDFEIPDSSGIGVDDIHDRTEHERLGERL